MNTTDRIADLMKQGATRITFATGGPNNQPLVAVEQMFGTESGHSKMVHEAVGSSHVEALEAVAKTVAYCADLQANVIRLNGH